jgi:hypothetical protein
MSDNNNIQAMLGLLAILLVRAFSHVSASNFTMNNTTTTSFNTTSSSTSSSSLSTSSLVLVIVLPVVFVLGCCVVCYQIVDCHVRPGNNKPFQALPPNYPPPEGHEAEPSHPPPAYGLSGMLRKFFRQQE